MLELQFYYLLYNVLRMKYIATWPLRIYTVKLQKQLELNYNKNSCITLLKMQKTYYAI